MSIELVMPSSHLILCLPLLLLSAIFPSLGVFSNESTLCIWWPKYWSFSFSPSNEYSGLISLGLTGLISLHSKGLSRVFQCHSLWASILWHSAFFMVQLSHPYMTTGKTTPWTIMDLSQQRDISAFWDFISLPRGNMKSCYQKDVTRPHSFLVWSTGWIATCLVICYQITGSIHFVFSISGITFDCCPGQEATVRIRHGTTDCFKIGKGGLYIGLWCIRGRRGEGGRDIEGSRHSGRGNSTSEALRPEFMGSWWD